MQHPPKKRIRKRQRGLMAALVCLALVMAAAFVLLIPVIQKQLPAVQPLTQANESTLQTLYRRSAEEVESISLNGFVLRMQEGELKLEKSGTLLSIDEDYAADLLEMAAQVVAQNTVATSASEVKDQLADMGLSPALWQMRVRFLDGSETLLELGAAVPNTPYYYFCFSETEGIYMADSGMLETLGLTESRLLPVTQPSIMVSLVDFLSLTNSNGESKFAFQNGTSAILTAPVSYPLTNESAQTLLTALGNFRLGTKEAEATAQNRSFYGLEDPLCVISIHQHSGMTTAIGADGSIMLEELPEQELRFVIGREEGEFFYTCEYDGGIYLISRFLSETLVKADWRTLLSKTPANMGDVPLTSILLETAEGTVEYRVTRTEKVLANNELEVDENGNIVYTVQTVKNGQTCTEDELNELIDRLNSLTVAGSLPDDYVIPSGEPRWHIKLTTENEVRVLEGWRLDAFSDAFTVNGVACHYLHEDAIEGLMAGLV